MSKSHDVITSRSHDDTATSHEMTTVLDTSHDTISSAHICQSTSDDDSGCALEEYAWVPPGLSPIQVTYTVITQAAFILF